MTSSTKSTPQVRSSPRTSGPLVAGLLLGLSAALVSVKWPDSLSALPTPSTLLVLLALALSIVGAGRSAITLRLGIIDAAFAAMISVWLIVELLNAIELSHDAHMGVLTTQLVLWAATIPPRLVIGSVAELRQFLFWVALPAIPVAILAVLQLARAPGVLEWLLDNVNSGGLSARIEAGRDDLRATSTIGHWTALGGYLSVAVALFCMELIFARDTPPRHRRGIVAIGIVILLVGQVTTLTFSTIGITAAIVVVTLIRLRINIFVVISMAVAGLLAWFAFGSEVEARLDQQSTVSRYTDESLRWLPSTVAYRVRIWQSETFPAIVERPLTGWGQQVYDFPAGWPTFPQTIEWASPESQWLNLLMRGGIADLVAFVFLLIALWICLHRSKALLGAATAPFTAALVSILITCTINSPFSTNGVPQILWPIIGGLLAATAIQSRGQTPMELRRG